MKRDLDLMRELLLKIESSSESRMSLNSFITDESQKPIIAFHIELLMDADFIIATKMQFIGQQQPDFLIQRLTNAGCDYLDAIRNDLIWNNTKEKILSIGGSATLEIIKAVAVAVAKTMLGI